MTSTICSSYLVIAGFSALAAHVGGANQFHWIGWYNVAIGGALFFVLIAPQGLYTVLKKYRDGKGL